jgi:tRNA-2-methylthio-N6-dimethylallyladenosine synthase
VFGTHNIGSLPVLLERARIADEAQVEILESLEVFPSTLPTKRESAYAAWVSISVGCNNTCTFCIVPALRGKEKDRRPGEILAEISALVAEGVTEITLLGQNVNAYGVEFGDRQAFSKLLRACGDVDGLERVRFTSPHPAEFTDDVILAMAETANEMPSLHIPLQSGSDTVLRDMRRSYRQAKYLGIISRVRAAIPDAAITTDIIVGFPGETEEDFAETLRVVREARFSGAFTFQYSKRPGTPAATLDGQIPPDVVRDRYERLVAVADEVAWAEGKRLVGQRVELMVAEGEGRKDAATHRLSGRAPDNRLVHFAPDYSLVIPSSVASFDGAQEPPVETPVRPGDMVTVEITYAAPHHLVADGPMRAVRRTRAGDAWEARQSTPASNGVSLGMPSIGALPPLALDRQCG